MRVPLSKVHRAFPELDRFSDEQCQRFVRAACRRDWRPWVHRAVLGVVLVPVTLVTVYGAIGASSWAEKWLRLGEGPFWISVVVALSGACLVPALLIMVLRDRLLLGRIRYLVRDRAVCPVCRYSLLGIVVGEDSRVICPECGMGVEADPSMKELVTDDEGRTRFQPGERVARRVFWTAGRVRRAKRAAIALGVLVFALLPASLGGYELFLRRQAALAAAERPGIGAVMDFIEANQPPGTTPSDPDAWEVLSASITARQAIDDKVTGKAVYEELGSYYGGSVYPDWESIYAPPAREDGDERAETDALARRLCVEILGKYRVSGLLDYFDGIAEAPRAVEPIAAPASRPAIEAILPTLGEARRFARMNAARMSLAWREGDREEFLRAFESTLALARTNAHQGALIQSLVAIATEELALQQARRCILGHPGPEWLDGIEGALDLQNPTLPPAHAIEGERLFILDAIAWTFADPGKVRLGRFSPNMRLMTGASGADAIGMRLGTYAGNRDAANAYFDAVAHAAGFDPADRPAIAPYPKRLALLDALMPAMEKYLRTADRIKASRRATAVMIALERYRLAHGVYPDSLSALVPAHLDALPNDPWTGAPMTYRAVGEGYTLYATGPDGQDNGGVPGHGDNGQTGIVYCPVQE